MKAVIASDSHLREKAGSYPLHLDETFLVPLYEIRDFILKNKIPYFFFLGDIFEGRVTLRSKVEFLKFLKPIIKETKVFLLMGNHDAREKDFYVFSELECFNFKNLKIISKPTFKNSLSLVPFVRKQRVFERILVQLSMLNKSVLFAHQQFKGAKYNQKFVEKQFNVQFPKNIRRVFSGHIHKPQILNNLIYYPGSTQRMNFGEEGEKKYFIYLKNNKIIFKPIKALRRLKTAFSVNEALRCRDAEVRVILNKTLSEKENSKLRRILEKNGSKLVYIQTAVPSFNVKGSFGKPTKKSKLELLQDYLDSKDFSKEVKKELIKRSKELFARFSTN